MPHRYQRIALRTGPFPGKQNDGKKAIFRQPRLSATDLKNRRLAQQTQAPSPAPGNAPQFIEVTPVGAAGGLGGFSGPQVELERPDGLRMRIGGATAGELGELVRVFMAGGRCCS